MKKAFFSCMQQKTVHILCNMRQPSFAPKIMIWVICDAIPILTVCFRRGGEEVHPSGLLPIVENKSARSFLTVERKAGGLYAFGRFAETLELFDSYQIADEQGHSVPPRTE